MVAAQAAGIWLADRGALGVAAALVLAACALALAAIAPRRAAPLAPLAVLLALCAGALSLGSKLDAAASARPRAPLEAVLEGSVREVARSAGWLRVELERVRRVDPGTPLPVRVVLFEPAAPVGGLAEALAGERLRLRARLDAPRVRCNPGAHASPRALARRGVGAVGRLVDPALVVRIAGAGRGRPLAAARRTLDARLVAAGEGGALLSALALGERAALRDATREAFAALGISHLLSVSGLHLVLVAGLAFAPLRWLAARCAPLAARGDARRVALAGAVCAASAYALIAGWDVPVRRSLVMLLALAAAAAMRRVAQRAEPLAAAALLVLAAEPQALFDPGAQLSFAATAGLCFAAPAREGRRPGRRLARALGVSLRTSATALAATAPITAQHFGRVAPLALAANLAAVPWTGAVLLPASLAAAAASACPACPGAGAVVQGAERVAGWSLDAVDGTAARLGAAQIGAAPGALWLAAAGGVALAALRVRGTAARTAVAAAGSLALAWAPPPAEAPPPPRAIAFDVGQGDSTLVQGRRAALLVDAGPALPDGPDAGRRVVVPALAALGVRRLDVVVATHADLDHRGGIPAVLAALPVGALWLPHGGSADEGFSALRAAARARGVPVLERGAGSSAERFGDLTLTPLWPPPNLRGPRNEASLVLRVEVEGRRLLLPGDIGARAERALVASGADVRADVLLLPHHGSRSSSTAGFLRAVAGVLAVASAPLSGRFGMPHAQVLARAREAGMPVWWTGRDGAVRIAIPRLAAFGSGACAELE
jgi:competence protein ComEC